MKTFELHVLRMCVMHSRVMDKRIVNEDYRATKAGFAGEDKVNRFLEEVVLTPKVEIYRNIVLDHAQMDIIVVTPKLICILEVKNMRGEFYFDATSKQFYRVIDGGKKEGMRNPELQLQRAVRVLQRKLNLRGVEISVQGLIVFASRAGIVMQPPTLFRSVPIDAMCGALEELEAKSNELLTNDDLKKIRHILKRGSYAVQDDSLMVRLGIYRNGIRPGVKCGKCFEVGMKRVYSTWVCGYCGCHDKDAHIATLQEYQLLFGSETTSRDVKWWLGIDDKDLTSRILKSCIEKYNGNNKNRVYTLKFEPWRLDAFLAYEMKKR
ncbi:nuclease-related domain-containing protein [Paenisporosarcina macmurdoensis]|uniref:Nuclease-related domain-containing protein n=1 Tax=Paenisporosarcina macmurdoensis TaxID=212659 RepID=A0ABW1L7N0_9BACL